jgi:tetratricopeptide (TPR) repeat protein
MGRLDVAIRLLEEDLTPKESMGRPTDLTREWGALARLRLLTGDQGGAAEAARTALRLDAGPASIATAAPILVRAGQPEEALRSLEALEASIPDKEARSWYLFRLPRLLVEGEVLYQKRLYQKALDRFQQADLVETPREQREYLVRTYLASGDKREAWRQAQRVAALGPFISAEPERQPPGAWSEALSWINELCAVPGVADGAEQACGDAKRRFAEFRDPNNIPILGKN